MALKRRGEMPELPRLKVKWWSLGSPEEEIICNLEQAKEVIFGNRPAALVFVEGEMINSYEELVQLAKQARYKGNEVISVAMVVTDIGGG